MSINKHESKIATAQLGTLRKIVEALKDKPDDLTISFDFIIASLFPTSWKNIQNHLNETYTQGYFAGRDAAKEESENLYEN